MRILFQVSVTIVQTMSLLCIVIKINGYPVLQSVLYGWVYSGKDLLLYFWYDSK